MVFWKRLGTGCAAFLLCCGMAAAQGVTINEIRIDQSGADNDEYFELFGTPGTDLSNLTYVVIGDGTGGSGHVEAALSLVGSAIPVSGYFLATESTFGTGTITGGPADLVTDLVFENSDNVTHLLVEGWSGAVDMDLDTNDDGVLDSMPWTTELDRIAIIRQDNPPTSTEFHYGPPTVGPDGNFTPAHVFRCPDGTGTWELGRFENENCRDTPGTANACNVCLCPELLSCSSDCGTDDIILDWEIPAAGLAYTGIEIFRNGVSIATLPGTDVTYTDAAQPTAMTYTYDVVATCMGGSTSTSSCTIDHCPCMGVSGVTCDSDCMTGNITLNWQNNDSYVSLIVRRDGVQVATLSPTDTTYTDLGVADGIYTYQIEVDCGPDTAVTECSVVHCVGTVPMVQLNEIRLDQPGNDDEEYFELIGPPGTLLDGLTYIVIGDGAAGSGVIEETIDLTGHSLDANGLFWAAEIDFAAFLNMGVCSSGSLELCAFGTPDLVLGASNINFENSDNVTHMLVFNFTGTNGDDLDIDDDGALDVTPWTTVVDCLALLVDPMGGDQFYCAQTNGPDGGFVPGHSLRCPGGVGGASPWRIGPFGGVVIDTPGDDNSCPQCFEIIDLVCSTDCVTGEVNLTWTNTDTYTDIFVAVNGTQTALPGTATSFSTLLAPGTYDIEVIGLCMNGIDTSTTCSIIHGPYGGETNVIFAGEAANGSVPSALLLQAALQANGQDALLIGQLAGYDCLNDLGPGDVLWVCNGSFPNKYFMTVDDGTALVNVLSNGASIYMEGAGTFVFDQGHPFDDYDGIDNSVRMPGVTGLADDTLTSLDGMAFSNVDVSALQDVTYNQDNQGGPDFNDTLTPEGATVDDVPDGSAGPIWANNPDDPMNPETPYIVALYFKTDGANGAQYGDVLTSTFEFGGFGGDQTALAGIYSTALRRVDMPPMGDQFRRGDCNNDGGTNIADAITLLGFLFPMGTPPALACVDACDCNDDGALNIADAVFALSVLFPPAGCNPCPVFPAPGGNCGLDTTSDLPNPPMMELDCTGYLHCP